MRGTTAGKDRCPRCGGLGAAILYGYPTGQMAERADRGEVVLGGCIVSGADPAWRCRDCRYHWGRTADANYSGAAFVTSRRGEEDGQG